MNMLAKQQRLVALLHRLAPTGALALAYSGGVDSRFLAFAAQQAGLRPVLFHVRGPHMAPEESAYALRWAEARRLSCRVLAFNPLTLPLVAAGDPQRCYACKKALFSRLLTAAGTCICDGSNASDAGEYRPGRRAVRELGILSPLARVGFSKADIRAAAAAMGMDDPDQPSRPCLLTRFPYGMAPTVLLLQRLAATEARVARCVTAAGLRTAFRLRVLEDGEYVLHVPRLSSPRLRRLQEALREAGLALRLEQLDRLSGYFDRHQLPQG